MTLSLFWNTVKYLKPVQIYGRIWHYIYQPRVPSLTTPSIKLPYNTFAPPIKKKRSLISPTRFRFLNQEHDVVRNSDWNNPTIDKLWLYNLHYFDYLNEEDSEKKNEIHQKIIEQWINENLPFSGNGWEPYPLSLRIVNWIKWFLVGNQPKDNILGNLYLQAWYLRRRLEFHLLGNHLIANAKALIFAGLFFSGNKAQKWLEKGLETLNSEIDEQIFADGGHFERSPMYHVIVLEDMLDLINIAQTYYGIIQANIVEKWRKKSKKMLSALSTQIHPDGEIAFFNDAAIGIAARPDQVRDYAIRLNIIPDEGKNRKINFLPDTGYYSVRRNKWHLIVDAGPIGPDYLPAHAHADTLSFELSMGTQRVLVNSGTSCYERSYDRLLQRKTPAHNALSVDRQDSSEVWSGFRVAKRAKIVKSETKSLNAKVVIYAAHNGFERLKSVGLHQRTWTLSDEKLVISDSVEGLGTHYVCVFFHFHPSIHVKASKDGLWNIYSANGALIATMELDKILEIYLQNGTYHPEFGITISNQVVIGKVKRDFPLYFSTRLVFI